MRACAGLSAAELAVGDGSGHRAGLALKPRRGNGWFSTRVPLRPSLVTARALVRLIPAVEREHVRAAGRCSASAQDLHRTMHRGLSSKIGKMREYGEICLIERCRRVRAELCELGGQRGGLSQAHADLTSARTSLSEAGAMRLAGLELDRVRRARPLWSANPRSGGVDGEPPGQQNNCANPKQRLVPHASALLSAGDRYARAARSLSLARTLSTHIECCASARSAGTRSNKHRVHARWIGKRRSIGIHVHH